MKLSSIPPDLIGQKWTVDRNCWWLVREVQRTEFGIDIPDYPLDSMDVRNMARAIVDNPETTKNWRRVNDPQHGDVVFLSRKTMPHHVGVWWHGGILHIMEGGYVCVQNKINFRLFGWKITDYYRHGSLFT